MRKINFTLLMLALLLGVNAQVWNIGSPTATNVTATLSGNTLTINGTGDMENFTSPDAIPWDYLKAQIQTVMIDPGVTSIGHFAFYDCSSLSLVNLGSVTSIGTGTFSGCTSLASVTIPATVTSINDKAFEGCNALTSFIVAGGNNNYSSGADGVLYNKLQTMLEIYPAGKSGPFTIPISVATIGMSAFYGCDALTAVTIPSSVTKIMDEAFASCRGLTAVTIPNTVTAIGDEAFYFCRNLADVTVGWANPSAVTLGTDAFKSIKSPATLHVPVGSETNYTGAWATAFATIQAPSTDATLKDITVSAGTLTPAFSSTEYSYTVNVANSIASITVTGTANHAGATVAGNGSHTLLVGTNTIKITVTAEDNSTQDYTVDIVRAATVSTDATLKDITVSAGTLTPAFSSTEYSYTVNVANSITSITVTGTANHAGATVTGNVTSQALNVGSNLITITVKAEDNSTQDYTVDIVRAASDDATLKGITVSDGSLDPAFDKDELAYTVNVPYSVDKITVTGAANHANATVAGDATDMPLTAGSSGDVVMIKVTAEDGSTEKTYIVTVKRAAPSTDATLKDLTVSDGSLDPAFEADKDDYTVEVPYSVEKITVTGAANHANATVAGNETDMLLTAGSSDVVTIKVTAEDGSTEKTYTVTVKRAAPSSDATLKSLTVSAGSLSPAFAATTTSYTVNVANSVTDITVTGEANDANAVSVTGNVTDQALNVGSNVITITVKAEDNSTIEIYTIDVVRAPSTDATLKSIALSKGKLSPAFDPATENYTVAIGFSIPDITVTGVANHASATVGGDNATAKPLAVGTNTVTVKVTAEDGTTEKTYTVTVEKEASTSDNAKLSGITLSAGTLSPAFNPAVTSGYTVAVPYSAGSITVTGEPEHTGATAVSTPAMPLTLSIGSNPVTIDVTAEDGTTTEIYTVDVVRAAASTDATLSGIALSDGTLSPAFAATTTAYTVNVGYSVSTITVTGTANDANATVSGNVTNKTLSIGSNPVTIDVTAEDGSTIETYTVDVVRAAASTDATLSGIVLSAGSLSPAFNSGTLAYTVNVSNSVSTITVTGTANDANASVTGNGTKTLNVGNNTVTITVTAEDGTTTKTYTVTVNRAAAPTPVLSVAAITFASAEQGYAQPAAQQVVITNSGNSAATVTSVTLTGSNAADFDFTGSAPQTVAAGGTNTAFSIRPKAGLATGTYTATLTVTYDGAATATAAVSFTVTVTRYTLTLDTRGNGSVSANQSSYKKGDEVVLTVAPDDGYYMYSMDAYRSSGWTSVSLNRTDANTYTFRMPDFDVTVETVFREIEVKSISLVQTADPLTVRVVNTGNTHINEYTLTLTGNDAESFKITSEQRSGFTPFTGKDLYVGDEHLVTLIPGDNLYSGTYSLTLTCSVSGATPSSLSLWYRHVATSGNENMTSGKLSAYTVSDRLHVSGLTPGKMWSVYNMSGVLLYRGKAVSDSAEISLQGQGVFVVVSEGERVKIRR